MEYSFNGTDWTSLGDRQFAQAPGEEGYAHDTTVDFEGVAAKYVRLTANSNWGAECHPVRLERSAVLLYLPVQPRQPNPASGATGVNPDVVLSWRPGREAASHEVYFSTDKQAVADGTALAGTATEAAMTPSAIASLWPDLLLEGGRGERGREPRFLAGRRLGFPR